jgi:hypothetical protein
MTVSQVAAQDHDPIRPFLEGLDDQLWIDGAGTHDPNEPEVRGVRSAFNAG